jgi:lipopolysaccharide biosynthesis regulator YciM
MAEGSAAFESVDNVRVLLEAATVAKMRAQTEPQLKRALSYLTAIESRPEFPLRVLGTMIECYALLGDRDNYSKYLTLVTDYRESHDDLRDSHLDALDEALDRAKHHLERLDRPTPTRRTSR